MAELLQSIERLDEGLARVARLTPGIPIDAVALTRIFLMVGAALQSRFEHRLRPHALTDSEFVTLMILFSNIDGTASPGELCEHTSQGATNMTRIANTLLKRRLIRRGQSKQDRRRVVISITPAGKRLVQLVLPSLYPDIEHLFADFSAAQLRTNRTLLRKLAHNLDQLSSESAA